MLKLIFNNNKIEDIHFLNEPIVEKYESLNTIENLYFDFSENRIRDIHILNKLFINNKVLNHL